MADDAESYLLLVLSDANLPTGSFVASAGLESHVAHAVFHLGGPRDPMGACIAFLRDSVATYARSALPFARDAQRIIMDYATGDVLDPVSSAGSTLDVLARLDALYDTNTLNHVSRRASRSQGVALLTLHSKGFTRPAILSPPTDDTLSSEARNALAREKRVGTLLDEFKLRIRRDETFGHLPVCWGLLAGALGLSLDRGAHLHLFLHARGVLSAAIRMNAIGPYAAQQLLLHAVRPMVDAEASGARELRTGLLEPTLLTAEADEVDVFRDAEQMPSTTWPLGELLAGRHDLLHSRIFNS
ncbi:urease accessory protein UreF [Auriscalpium vulgare]|uniref:Urease accessory protein UreF n=1 Tax=Auriscalpium vulgare TaxID=40419 RepID=A0ACB8RX60_9AGAM|nr:urease accessory protein UreF [Auriscalpium vulgare]